MNNALNARNEKKWPYIIAVSFVLFWTIWHSFLGVDLVDTGYYYYQYIHPTADNISYSTYLATLIGAVWIRLFPKLGLWGLNVLELLLEYILCLIVYLTFKNTFRKKSIVIGIVFCMVAISTYVNAFNYHQLSMFLCTSMLCCMYTGLRTEKVFWHAIAGVASFLSIINRFPCILTLLCITCIIYWRVFVKKNIKRTASEIAMFTAGFIAAGVVTTLVLKSLGVWDKVINDVFRMSNLSGSGVVSYGVDNQFKNLIKDTLHGVEAAVFFLLCACLISFGLYYYYRNILYRKESVLIVIPYVVLSSFLMGFGIFGSYFATYVIGRAPNFIQLTSFSWFIYGAVFLAGMIFVINGMIKYLKIRQCGRDMLDKEVKTSYVTAAHHGVIAYMGLALVLLSFVGSAARSKHAILGMWFIVILLIDKLFDVVETVNYRESDEKWTPRWIRMSICATVAVFLVSFAWFVANTNNFDEPNVFLLKSQIENDRVKYLKTTKREAESVDAIVAVITANTSKGDYLMVIGNPIMLYALSERNAYVRPWVTGSSYLVSELKEDIERATKAEHPLPMIIEAKTDPYRGFSEDTYQEQIISVAASYEKSEKVKCVRAFMEENKYQVIYESDYFKAYLPGGSNEE